MAGVADPFTPYIPDFSTVLMPPAIQDANIHATGMTFGWMKGHVCPCTYGSPGLMPGTPNPKCATCFGRGWYWDPPIDFIGDFTYMHTSAAPDEPGVAMNSIIGQVQHAAPTLSIPYTDADGNPSIVWADSGDFDAYVETQVSTRFNTPLVAGDSTYLPYKQNLCVTAVTAFDTTTLRATPVSPNNYTVDGAQVVLNPAVYPDGTGYVVEYKAAPVYVAWRRSGGVVHARPFGDGTPLPKRYHLENLDVWLRTLNNAAAQSSPI